MSVWNNSSFLNLVGAGVTTASTTEAAYGITAPTAYAGTVTMALVLPRMNDPTALLGGSYAQREAVLNGLTPTQVGAMFGASQSAYDALTNYIGTVAGASLASTSHYVSSAQSQTVWVTLDAAAFQTLFGTPLLNSGKGFAYWDGNLTPNANIASLAGAYLPSNAPSPPATPLDTTGVPLTDGPQGVANTSGGGYTASNTPVGSQGLYPDQIAASYELPLAATGDTTLATPTIGLIEPGAGDIVDPGSDPNQLIQSYRSQAGVSGTGTISEGTVETAPTTVPSSEERSLDVGVVATAAPNSDIVTYAGTNGSYAAIQEAIWGGGPQISELSTSFGLGTKPLPGSPFYVALEGLYTDAALNNITFLNARGDGGSGGEIATGLPATNPDGSDYNIAVGGTSTSDQQQVAAAGAATTDGGPNINSGVAALLTQAIAGNAAALEILVAGGLLQDPTATSNVQDLLQTVWNQYDYRSATNSLNPGYPENEASAGGVSTGLAEPAYQLNAGIDTQALQQADGVTPASTAGKGLPDVSALAGGNTHYLVPQPDLTSTSASGTPDPVSEGGTSASAPLWAALVAQIQAVFTNEGLPALGTMNDLLYQASVIDPAAFDDVQFGSDTSSFVISPSGTVTAYEAPAANGTQATETIIPTGLGYTAAPGYDLASGLGTPDGVLLARALTQIAETQEYSPSAEPVTDVTSQTSAASQTLIVQPTLTTGFTGAISVGGASFTPASDGSGQGWSARIAQQTLQSYFAPALATAIAGQAQASSTQVTVGSGQALAPSIGGVSASPLAEVDTTGYGFVDYTASGQSVTLARPLAVADTYGGQDDTNAIVRIRQDSADTDTLAFYRVDDLTGTIAGLAPGQAGYAAAAATRAYAFAGGALAVTGPGDGGFLQTDITGVNEGDIIAFQATDQTSGETSWGLASQNSGDANALWSYGSDTWGFDDGSAGGSGFDSLVFQLDFTSDAGSGLLAYDTSPACFASGTLIETATGQRPVERLAIGDMVVTAAGDHRPVRWIGRRCYAGRFLAANPGVQPVRISPGALGNGLPRRTLLVSPEHAMLLDGVLVPARCLVNGRTIVQERGLQRIDYYHVELESHDVLLAEGAPAESFLDDDSRGVFHNASEFRTLYPDARPSDPFCARRLEDGPEVEAIRRRLEAGSHERATRARTRRLMAP